jgi:hypothetical protein
VRAIIVDIAVGVLADEVLGGWLVDVEALGRGW